MKKVCISLGCLVFLYSSCGEPTKTSSQKDTSLNKSIDTFQDLSIPKQKPAELSKEDSLALVEVERNKKKFRQAIALVKKKEFDKASILFRKLLLKKALTPESILKIASKYVEANHRFCIELCEFVLHNSTKYKNPNAYFIQSLYYEQNKQYETAIKLLDKAILNNWTFVEAFIKKGIIYFNQGKLALAYETFNKAKTIHHRYPDIYYWLARCEERMDKKTQAMMNYQRAIFFDRNFSEAKRKLEKLKNKK